jgi:hypothetical protein
VAQGVDPEFKSQYHTQTNKNPLFRRNTKQKDIKIIIKRKRQVKIFYMNAEKESKFWVFLNFFNSNPKKILSFY